MCNQFKAQLQALNSEEGDLGTSEGEGGDMDTSEARDDPYGFGVVGGGVSPTQPITPEAAVPSSP
eukprot:1781696-Alexandrium_andersonii.AAC.1